MTREGLFPNISTLGVVYGYDTLHCVQGITCNQWIVFSTLDLFPQPVSYTRRDGGETLYVVAVMTLFIQLMEGYFVMEKEEEEA